MALQSGRWRDNRRDTDRDCSRQPNRPQPAETPDLEEHLLSCFFLQAVKPPMEVAEFARIVQKLPPQHTNLWRIWSSVYTAKCLSNQLFFRDPNTRHAPSAHRSQSTLPATNVDDGRPTLRRTRGMFVLPVAGALSGFSRAPGRADRGDSSFGDPSG